MRAPRILVFDSGLGGLTVFAEIAKLRPGAEYLYAADDAAFPYGRLDEATVVARVEAVLERLISAFSPDIVVIACNTASTLVLPHLRRRWGGLPFVGTVPAVKPAAAASRSRMISVLATPGTVTRDYTQALIREHAAHCEVTLVGSEKLAGLAEQYMRGQAPDHAALAAELAPCFVEQDGRRTDHIVLACTHYPLLLPLLRALAGRDVGWPVEFVDPAPAIARRTDTVLAEHGFSPEEADQKPLRKKGAAIWFSSGAAPDAALAAALAKLGLTGRREGALPFPADRSA